MADKSVNPLRKRAQGCLRALLCCNDLDSLPDNRPPRRAAGPSSRQPQSAKLPPGCIRVAPGGFDAPALDPNGSRRRRQTASSVYSADALPVEGRCVVLDENSGPKPASTRKGLPTWADYEAIMASVRRQFATPKPARRHARPALSALADSS